MVQTGQPFTFTCPHCGGLLTAPDVDTRYCAADELTFVRENGIWRFLLPARQAALAQFRRDYEAVRRAEGRGSDDPAYYQALPFCGEPDGRSQEWAIRAQSFRVLVEQVVEPLAQARKRPLRVLDLGAGNGWLSHRLAQQGHHVAAVDLAVNDWDGLGAHRHYDVVFTPVQAEFDRLPLAADQADLAIFNASFHYSVSYEQTLNAVGQVLRPDGRVAVVDTPVYREASSGQQMVAEREVAYRRKYGFASNALPSKNFLTFGRLSGLEQRAGIHWQLIQTVPRWRRLVRRLKVALRRQREPAQFPLLVGQFTEPQCVR